MSSTVYDGLLASVGQPALIGRCAQFARGSLGQYYKRVTTGVIAETCTPPAMSTSGNLRKILE